MNDPQINLKNTPLDNEDIIIERHEDGSECRKCKNCACVNNKLATAGLEIKTSATIEIQETASDPHIKL